MSSLARSDFVFVNIFFAARPQEDGVPIHFDEDEMMPLTNVGGRPSAYTDQFFASQHVQSSPTLTVDGWRAMLSNNGQGTFSSSFLLISSFKKI